MLRDRHATTYFSHHYALKYGSRATPRRRQFHVAPAMPALKYTTSVDIQKMRYKKLVAHVESHASAVGLLESGE